MTKYQLILGLAACLAATGCGVGSTVDCAVNGDNVKGRVNFAQGIPVNIGAHIKFQYSVDNFTTTFVGTDKQNLQGLSSIPYGFCAGLYNTSYQFRAFVDLNGNGTLDAGEPSGRYDGTDTGNAGYIANKQVTQDAAGKITRLTGIDITIDTP